MRRQEPVRRSSRVRKPTASYRDADDDDDSDGPAEAETEGGPSYAASRDELDGVDYEEEEEEEEGGEDASDDEDDDDEEAPRGAAQGKAPKGSASKKVAAKAGSVARRAKKLKTAGIGMKGLVEYSTSDAAGCKVRRSVQGACVSAGVEFPLDVIAL